GIGVDCGVRPLAAYREASCLVRRIDYDDPETAAGSGHDGIQALVDDEVVSPLVDVHRHRRENRLEGRAGAVAVHDKDVPRMRGIEIQSADVHPAVGVVDRNVLVDHSAGVDDEARYRNRRHRVVVLRVDDLYGVELRIRRRRYGEDQVLRFADRDARGGNRISTGNQGDGERRAVDDPDAVSSP